VNPLQDLKDIRIPAFIENWPPAYGWWLLLGFVILGIYLLTLWFVKFRKIRITKRQALRALQQINGLDFDSLPQLNQLLKRVVIAYFPDHNVQKMHGVKWTEFLVSTLPSNKAKDFSGPFELMQNKLYQPRTSEEVDYPIYSKSVETWIKHALPPNKDLFTHLEQNHA
jgi:hypothetical protein